VSKPKENQEVPLSKQSNQIPEVVLVDITPEVYQKLKEDIIEDQPSVIKPHILDYFEWLKSLDPLDVYDAIETGQTVKDAYNKEKPFSPFRTSVAVARGVLRVTPWLKTRAKEAFNEEIARLTLRFENPDVWDVIQKFDQKGDYLRSNIQAAKEILGLEKPSKGKA